MANLNPLELERLKSLLSGKALTMGEKISTLDMLRSRLPGFFSSLKPGLTEENLKDNNFLIKYLTNPYNRHKIKNALRSELSLTTTQEIELEQALSEKPIAAEEIGGQPTGQEATPATGQEMQPTGGTGAPTGGMPFGMPSAPSISPRPGRVFISNVPQTPEPPKPEISIANSSGTIIKGPGAEAPPSSIVLTDSSGNILKTHDIPPQSTTPLPTTKKFNLSSFTSSLSSGFKKVQNFASPAGPFFKLNSGRIIRSLGGLAKAGTAGAYNFGAKIGNGGLNALERISRPGGSGGILGGIGRGGGGRGFSISKVSQGKGKWVLAGVLGFMVLVGGLTAFAPNPTPGEASPIAAGGDISSCKFTRSGDPVKELTYKSPLLLSYIQEASNLTGIPAVVLAAFIRVETPSTVTKTDDEIRNLSSVAACPRSQTGALGVMQLQPQGTTGHDEGAIANGAKLIGKKYEELTEADYCDVKKNVIMGAGFILKKLSYKTTNYPTSYGDGTQWDPSWTNNRSVIEKLVDGYYGCLAYGGPDPLKCEGPFNYADDVSTSIQNCQIAASGMANLCPATGKISTPYGFNIPDYPQEVGNEGCGNLPGCHNGVDIAANEGSPVKSTISGTVLISGSDRYKGNYVEINNPTSGLTVTFEHLATIKVAQNSSVSPGQEIGTVGKTGEGVTGPVLHYKIKSGGILVNPLRTLSSSATIDANTLTVSDDIAQNDYSSRKPVSPDGYWGDCR